MPAVIFFFNLLFFTWLATRIGKIITWFGDFSFTPAAVTA